MVEIPDTKIVTLDDRGSTRIAYREAGSGDLVVLLHGLPDTIATWSEIMPRLERSSTRRRSTTAP